MKGAKAPPGAKKAATSTLDRCESAVRSAGSLLQRGWGLVLNFSLPSLFAVLLHARLLHLWPLSVHHLTLYPAACKSSLMMCKCMVRC